MARFLIAGLLAFCSIVPAQGGMLGLDLTSGGGAVACGVCGNSFGQTFGWKFSVSSSITVDGLGVWDAGSDGIGTTVQVGLWNSVGTLLASTKVSDISDVVASGSVNGRWLFEDITSLSLLPGTYTIGSVFFNSVPLAQTGTGMITIPEITVIGGVRRSGSDLGLAFPVTASPFRFGPTLRVVNAVVPEPASVTLLGMGFAGLMGYSWKRRKQA